VARATVEQRVVPPAVKVTVPVGMTLVECREATVAVKAAEVPYVTVLPELETSVVVVGSLLTVWVTAADVELAKLLELGV
jgi:precorrin isomerase